MSDTSKAAVSFAAISDLLAIQMRNAQAIATAQQKMFEGLNMLSKQQAQILDGFVRRAFDSTQATPALAGVRDSIGARIDALKQSIMETLANSNALSEIMMRSAGEVASVLQDRMMAALDEVKALAEETIPEQLQARLPGPANIAVDSTTSTTRAS
jgi:hypothetical protein